ncbi:T9SS type A sorting domain-containing protein [Flavobacterium sp.]|uniref:T9SS type A sorting domain-containing protein n=1 Tax=Flavobacterium sp. TaxID=239 RepID=UPI002FDB8DF2
MKKITLSLWQQLAILFLLLTSSFAGAQCIRTTPYLSVASNNSGVPQTIATCAYGTEYCTVTGLLPGANYLFSEQSGSTGGAGTHLFLTVTDLSNNVLAYGTSPLTINAINTTDVRLHFADDANCAGASTCRNSQVQYLATCQAPTATVFSAITLNSATVSWTASATTPANGYEYYYATSNTAPTAATTPSGSVAAGVTTVDLNGLSSGTTYYVWERAVCSASDSSIWSVTANFSTLCNLVTAFTEDFENTTGANFPSCWAKVGTTGASYPQTSTGISGARNLYMYSSTSTSQAVVSMTPVSNADAGTHQFRAKVRANFTAGETLQFGYLTNPSDATTFVSLGSIVTNSTTVAQNFVVSPVVAPTGITTLALRTGTLSYSVLIDDVAYEPIPTCIEPTALTASAVTAISATVSWTASATPPANGYEYYFSTSNTAPTAVTPVSGAVAAGILTTDLSGLSPATTYYFWARSVCSGSDSSIWSSFTTFTTSCMSATVPYTQDFESAVVPAVPTCTSTQNIGPGNNWTVAANPGYGFASKTLRYAYSLTNAANTWFYTNGITLTAGTNYTISYKYGNNSTTYTENLKVAYGTSPTATAMTTVLADYPGITGGTTTSSALLGTVDFTPSVSGDYYFGFNAYSLANEYYLFVDDISVTTALANPNFDANSFTFYPNPVKDVLNIGYNKTITTVAIYNVLGQEMLVKAINADQSQINVSYLSKGTYLVKVTAEDGATKTIKVIKE